MAQRLQVEALVVHLFVAADGPDRGTDHAYPREAWRRCADPLVMTATIANLPTEPDLTGGISLLAARRGPQAAGSPWVQGGVSAADARHPVPDHDARAGWRNSR
jgi:hypothetical protein